MESGAQTPELLEPGTETQPEPGTRAPAYVALRRIRAAARRRLLLEAWRVAVRAAQHTWIIDNVEPYAVSLRPERRQADAEILACLALAHVETGAEHDALGLLKRLPLQQEDLMPALLLGLCVRALAKHAAGQKASARGDLARVYAADPGFPWLRVVQDIIDRDSQG